MSTTATASAKKPTKPPTNDPPAILPDPARLGLDDEAAGARILAQQVSFCKVESVAQLDEAAKTRKEIGDALRKIDAFFEPVVSMAFKLHRALTARRNAVRQPWEQADRLVSEAMSAFKRAEDQRRRAEELRLAEEQRKAEEIRMLAEAAALEAQGETHQAAAVLTEALAEPAPVVALQDVTKGVANFRTVWKWRYVRNDQAYAMKQIPREYLQPNETRIGAVVRHMQGTTKIPGIEVYSEEVPIR